MASAIDAFPVYNSQDFNDEQLAIDGVDDPIWPHAKCPSTLIIALQLLPNEGILTKNIEGIHDTFLAFLWKGSYFFFGSLFDDNRIHVQSLSFFFSAS